MAPLDRNDLMERDLQAHAKTITELTNRMAEYEKAKAVEEVKDAYLEVRLSRIEKIGWWILTTFGASFVALVANFLFKGGFYLAK